MFRLGTILRVCPSALLFVPFRPSAPRCAPQFSQIGKSKLQAMEAGIPKVRNIGIVAHIDAGKTTTTERMLYYAGVVKRVGDVDSGTTTTDFMKEEMDRGITIQSAAVSLTWKEHTIHLIDTPGHVDFTVEVERAMRVVDGVVALFDASAGVQAQSYTVLRQSRKFQVPVIAFINKMDKFNADFHMAVGTIREKLKVEPLLLQQPLKGEDGSFEGVIDLIAQKTLRFSGDHGSSVAVQDLKGEHTEFAHVVEAAVKGRSVLIQQLTASDDALSEEFIEALDKHDGDEVASEAALSEESLRAAVRRLLLGGARKVPVMPVLCGASRRDQGVQPLLDAVNYYLPSPKDRKLFGLTKEGLPVPLPPVSSAANVPTVALAFKVTHAVGPNGRAALVFLRVYSGCITPKMTLVNHTQNKHQTIDKLYVMHANNPVEVPHLAAGDIGAAFLKDTFTGDTLSAPPVDRTLQSKAHVKPTEETQEVYTLEGIEAPPAVLSFTVEAANLKHIELLETALGELCREDPSLRVEKSEFGNIVLRGMGELHLEIALSRLHHEFQVQCRLLRAVVEYREALRTGRAVEKVLGLNQEIPYMECSLELRPMWVDEDTMSATANCSFGMDPKFVETYVAGGVAQRDARSARAELQLVETCFKTAVDHCCRLGPMGGLPMHGLQVVLTHFRKVTPNAMQERILGQVCRTVVGSLLAGVKSSEVRLVEPMMRVEVHLSDPTFIGAVVTSLNEHRAITVEVLEDGRSVGAIVAMRNIIRYTTELRKAVKGHANLFTSLDHYRVVEDKAVLSRIFKNIGIDINKK